MKRLLIMKQSETPLERYLICISRINVSSIFLSKREECDFVGTVCRLINVDCFSVLAEIVNCNDVLL